MTGEGPGTGVGEVPDPAGRLVSVRHEGRSRLLVLNRPEKKNALNDELLDQLSQALREAETDEGVRTIILVGAGACFSSGRDQKDAGSAGSPRAILQDGTLERTVGIFTAVLRQLLNCPKPTVAAVHGMALAGGQALTLACDFVVAERGARFGNPEMQFGFPAAMNTVLLAHHIGRRKALEIALTGAIYSAEAYAALGLVNRLAEPGALDEEVRSFARALDALPPWAVRQSKQLFRTAEKLGIDDSVGAADVLNQLLRANAQLAPVFEDPAGTRGRLQAQLEPKERS